MIFKIRKFLLKLSVHHLGKFAYREITCYTVGKTFVAFYKFLHTSFLLYTHISFLVYNGGSSNAQIHKMQMYINTYLAHSPAILDKLHYL